VRLILTSNDVIHSLFIPAFRVKRDAVPGRYNYLWFHATMPGDYLALCSEYCGRGHSDMLARVVVHEAGLYERWLDEASDPFRTHSLTEVGEMLVARRCSGCHSVTGAANTGPTFKGLYGHEAAMADGTTVMVEENYIRESIFEPRAKVVRGFEPVMPTFKGQLKDQEITAIIEYLKKLSE
jgi:cytochrome c oxidase subunit II